MIAHIYRVLAIAKHSILSNLHDLSLQQHHEGGVITIFVLQKETEAERDCHLWKVSLFVSG